MTKNKTQRFSTNFVEWTATEVKGGKDYYVKGYISTDEIDRVNDVVSREGMQGMLEQIKSGNIKLDVEHETFINKADIAIGKITNAGIDEKGLWIEAKLNKAHSRFGEVWSSIQDGFLDAFSIAYNVVESAYETVSDTTARVLKSLELLNVALTGTPVCKGAKMTESFYKSLKAISEETMAEETPEPKVEPEVTPAVEPKVEEPVVEEPKEEPKAEEPVAEPEQPKEEPKVEEPVAEPEPVINPLDEIKSLKAELEKLQQTNNTLTSELKSVQKGFDTLKEDVSKTQLKAVTATATNEVVEKKQVALNPLDSIN